MKQFPVGQNALIRGARHRHKPWLALAAVALLSACSGSPPEGLGVRDGRLSACPSSPNCVASQADDTEHRIEPLALRGTPQETRAHLLALLASEPRAEVVAEQDNYLRVQYTSKVLRFVDDVEFLIGPQAVEVRSASRLGYADFGVNRARIEELRQRLQASD